jgi:hypothetical protein
MTNSASAKAAASWQKRFIAGSSGGWGGISEVGLAVLDRLPLRASRFPSLMLARPEGNLFVDIDSGLTTRKSRLSVPSVPGRSDVGAA